MSASSALSYPARFAKEKEGGYSVSFVDFPEAHTQGETKDEAFRMAIDCLHAAIEYRLEDREEIPAPSEVKRGRVAVPVPLEVAPKVALYRAMRDKGISNVKLAKTLRVTETVIRRMLNPKHKSTPQQYTRALAALGRAVEVSVVEFGDAA